MNPINYTSEELKYYLQGLDRGPTLPAYAVNEMERAHEYRFPSYWHGVAQGRLFAGLPVSARVVEMFGLTLPKGYFRRGTSFFPPGTSIPVPLSVEVWAPVHVGAGEVDVTKVRREVEAGCEDLLDPGFEWQKFKLVQCRD